MADSVDTFECSICLQLLQDPVTAACGHNYCLACINSYWDSNSNRGNTYLCPQCRESFYPRPTLKKNTLLCDLLEECKRSTGQRDTGNAAAAAAAAAAGGTDTHEELGLSCDVCKGTNQKASMFCCVCLVSFCNIHLQPHFEVPPLKKHSLIPASARAKESICSCHNRLVEIYCRTDQQFICLMCVMEEHKDHNTVTVAARQCEIKSELDETMQSMKERMLEAEMEMFKLSDAADDIRIPQHESKDKKMKFFSSGTVAMDVDIEKSGFFQGEGIKVIAHIQNNSSREIKPKFCMYSKHSFFAEGRRRLNTKDLVKEVGEPIPPSAKTMVTRIITIPHDMEPSILDCKILKVEHRLRDAAWEASNEFEQLCEEFLHSVISSMKLRCAEMRGKVQEAEKAGVDWIDDHLRKRQREVWTLKKRQDKINHLALIKDPIQFIQEFQRSDLESPKHLHGSLDQLPQFVAAQEDKIKNLSNNEKTDIYVCSKKYLLLKSPRLPQIIISRTKPLATYTDVEMDPNTVGSCLCLSDNNKEIFFHGNPQTHPYHQDRFTFYPQALCMKGLEGNHYWEVEWDGGVVEVAVAYKGINRQGSGNDCCFGHNHMSWKLKCSSSGCTFWHNSLHKGNLRPVKSCRVGIHLDFKAGMLAFYSVTDRLILLHKTQTTFTEPVYPGFSVDLGAALKICNI